VDNDLLAETRRHFTVNFDLIITAEQVGSYKPEPRHFQEAKKKIGQAKWLHAAQSYYHDIVPCNRNSIEAAWINRKQEPLHDPEVVPLCQVSNLIAFVNWIEEVE
jgi:2-haloacid dehalogenase/putative hydrolase of the HAD superfamily